MSTIPGRRLLTSIPLAPDFRFAHEPLATSQDGRFVGRVAELQALAERVFFSTGGSFLITGYRGVGKTSFVNQVIARVRKIAGIVAPTFGAVEVVDIYMSIARQLDASELMHHIVRRLYERLNELNLFDSLPEDLRNDITLAYRRTSMSITNKLAETFSKEYGITEAGLAGPLLAAVAKFSMTRSESRSRDHEFSFLAYDDKAAENDVLRIARKLTDGFDRSRTRFQRMTALLRRRPPRVGIKVIFIFDELDKLDEESDAKKKPFLDRLLSDLKNLFTTSGLSFIFVAGKDLYDRWLADVGRGDSVYESVFCYDRYLPCMWTDVGRVCSGFIGLHRPDEDTTAAQSAFLNFLKYRGRGIPRRIVREFNQFVRWSGDQPQLSFNADDIRRFRFYGELQDALESDDAEMFGANRDVSPTDDDKSRLGAYYVIDWVLAHGAAPFTAEEAVAASRALSAKIAPTKELAASAVASILRMLVKHEFLEEVKRDHGSTIVPEAEARRTTQYRLTPRRLAELGHFAAVYEEDRVPAPPTADAMIGRYRIIDQIGRGGYGSVFRAEDISTGRIVAIKVLSGELSRDKDAVARFEREARVLGSLRHANIVSFFDMISAPDKHAIVMDLVDGMPLDTLIAVRSELPLSIAVTFLRQAAEAIDYVQRMGIARTDLKPSNMLIRKDGQLLLTDFGIARPLNEDSTITREGFPIGTPAYMAPEQISESETLDLRSDIWSLGVVFYEMLAGHPPFAGRSFVQLVRRILDDEVPHLSDMSKGVNDFIQRCLRKSPAERFQTPKELLDALKAIPDPAPVDVATFIGESVSRKEDVKRRRERQTAEVFLPVTGAHRVPGPTPIPDPSPVSDPPPSPGPPRAPVFAPAPPPPPLPASITQVLAVSDVVTAGEPHLIIQAPSDLAGRVISIPIEGKATIGRASDAQILIDHPSLTRYHCEISRSEVRDLNSSNGTFVNEKPVREWTPLADGDTLRLGVVVTTFHATA
jgi:serine/threonine protein kinase/Cdc6-like AAA superfamily ATPase